MATHRIPILTWAANPGNSDVFFEPYTVKASNDVFAPLVAVFNNTSTKDGLHGRFTVPKNYSSNAKIIIFWTTTVTSGNVVWDFDYRAIGGDDAESMDPATTQESVTVTDAAPSAAHERMVATLSLTSGNLAVDDSVPFTLFRDGADASDTAAAAAILFEALFEYTDS